MPIVDIDGHLGPYGAWLAERRPDLAQRLPAYDMGEALRELLYGDVVAANLPREHRSDLVRDFEARIQSKDGGTVMMTSRSGIEGTDPAARVQWLDRNRIDMQFINSNDPFTYKAATRTDDRQFALDVLSATNDMMFDTVYGYTDRLIPVSLLELDDIEWACAELRRARERGSRVVQIRAKPVDGMSLAHPHFDRVWSTMTELGQILYFHVGATQPTWDPGWFNAGENTPMSYISQMSSTHTSAAVEDALASMIFGGVFHRHPRLAVGVSEVDVRWVPYWLVRLDGTLRDAKWRDMGWVPDYRLPLLPSEYARNHVRVTPLAVPVQDPLPLVEPLGDMLVFSTDFPHPEGTGPEGIEYYERLLVSVAPAVRERFFGGSMHDVLARADGRIAV